MPLWDRPSSKNPWPDADADADPAEPADEPVRVIDPRFYDPELDARIVDWRVLCFLDAGFTALAATSMAIRRDVNRVDVERLLDNGASHDQVQSIVL